MRFAGSGACRALLLVALAVAILDGCNSAEPRKEAVSMAPMTLPDLSLVAESVQTQLTGAFEAFTDVTQRRDAASAEKANAYGSLANLLLAADFYDQAEVGYLNAQTLAPQDARWPYYLGHLYRERRDHEASAAAFDRALQLEPDDVPTLVWLGESYLALDRPAEAEPYLLRALALRPDLAAVLGGLGRAALAQGHYEQAVGYLERALTQTPDAVSLHYPLGMAFRGLGKLDLAELHLDQRGDTEVLMPDPRMQELGVLLRSASAYESNGIRALEHGEWEAAADLFRRGLELDPDAPSLQHRLGTALYLLGEAREAKAQFERVVHEAPEFAPAYYSLGVMAASDGHVDEAIRRFSEAVAQDPDYVEARVALGGFLRNVGRAEEALAHYTWVVQLDPTLVDARLGGALALVRLGRWADARDWLDEAVERRPDDPELAHALARVLAAAPDDQVRDGQQALRLMDNLFAQERTVERAEALAMALAEVGQYNEAVSLQQELITVARRQAWPRELLDGLTENLRRYQQGLPCRSPWTAGLLP